MFGTSNDPFLDLLLWKQRDQELDRRAHVARLVAEGMKPLVRPPTGMTDAVAETVGDALIATGLWLKRHSRLPVEQELRGC